MKQRRLKAITLQEEKLFCILGALISFPLTVHRTTENNYKGKYVEYMYIAEFIIN